MFHAHLLRYALWRGLPALLNFATITLLTLALHPSEYGVYALVLSGASLLNAMVLSWVQQGFVRHWRLATGARERDVLVASTTVGLIVSFGVGLLALRLASGMLAADSEWRQVLPFVPVIAAAQASRLLLLELGRARLRPDSFGGLVVANALITAVGAPWAAFATHDVRAVLLVLVVAEVTPGLPVLWKARYRLARALRWEHVHRARLSALLRFGVPLTASALLAQGLFTGTRALLVMMLGTTAAGMYSAAYDLAQRAVTACMQLVNLGSVPLLLDAVARKATAERDLLLHRNLLWSLIAGVPLALLLALLAEPIAGTFLAAAYAPTAAVCIPWVVLGVVANRLRTNHTDLAFVVSGRTSRQLLASAVGATVGLGGTWLLAPRIGVQGAAIATAAGYVSALVCSLLLGRGLLALPCDRSELARLALSLSPLALLLVWQPAEGAAVVITAALLVMLVAANLVALNVDGLRSMSAARIGQWRYAAATRSGRTS